MLAVRNMATKPTTVKVICRLTRLVSVVNSIFPATAERIMVMPKMVKTTTAPKSQKSKCRQFEDKLVCMNNPKIAGNFTNLLDQVNLANFPKTPVIVPHDGAGLFARGCRQSSVVRDHPGPFRCALRLVRSQHGGRSQRSAHP